MIIKTPAQRRRRLLARTFFDRMFENDLFSSSVSASNAVMWLLAALATPGVMFSGSQYYFYAHARTFEPAALDRILFVSEVFHVGFAMAIAGIITALVWTSIAPDRRDALVLGPLPVNAGEQAWARLLALLRFFVMFATAVSVPTAFAFTFVTVGDGAAAEVPARVAGHVTATLLGAAFVFFLLVGAQVVLASAFGPRAVRAAAWPLQAAVIVGMVAALSMTDHLADVIPQPEAITQGWVASNPAAWFVGVYRWVAGDPREVFWLLASRGFLVTAILAGGVLVAYPLAYRRCLAQAIAAEGRRATWWIGGLSRLWLRALRPLLPTPLERGVAAFMMASLTRSHAHRFLVGSYLGLALLFALPLTTRLLLPASSAGVQYAWFAVPLGIVCWAAAAMRVAMMLPIEPAANWIFKLTEPVDKARIVATAVVVTQSAIVAPIAVIFAIAAWIAGGWPLGAAVAGVVAATGAALVELLMLTLRTVPGACTYRPGQLRLRTLWPLYLAIWVSIAYVLPTVAVRALDGGFALALIVTLTAACLALRAWRLRRSRRLAAFVYEEQEPETSTTVRLGPSRT